MKIGMAFNYVNTSSKFHSTSKIFKLSREPQFVKENFTSFLHPDNRIIFVFTVNFSMLSNFPNRKIVFDFFWIVVLEKGFD
jgi:hypothetical protein